MKRRNAETGKMRRPIKRTKISEGVYGNSMLYLKFVMLWATVVMADYMLEFRFEFLWPFWMMLRSVYDSFKYQGLAFSVFFICIALTSDMICFFFIPVQWIFFAASTYVWVQYVWYTVADKGICLPTVALCCALVYVEGAVRGGERGGGLAGGGFELCRPLAAHCVGYPVITLGFGVKSYVGHRMRLRRQRQVQAENEFYFQIMRDALPESAAEQNQTSTKESEKSTCNVGNGSVDRGEPDHKHMNGTATPAATAPTTASTRSRRDRTRTDLNGSCHHEHSAIQINTKVEKHNMSHSSISKEKDGRTSHALSNGAVVGELIVDEDDRRDASRGSAKSSKCEKREKDKESSMLKEEKRKNRSKDKDNCDSHKSTEQSKENILREKDIESTRENVKSNKENNSSRDKERERERERELREGRECVEELRRVRSELVSARTSEAEARRLLAESVATDRIRRGEHQQLRQAHATLQHKLSSWRGNERASLERRLTEERRARAAAEQQLVRAQHQLNARKSSECESETCRSRRCASETESAALRRELQRARETAHQLQRDLAQATEKMSALESRSEETRLATAWAQLQERAVHLEHSLSSETRVKLDLLSALGEAKRQLNIREGKIAQQEKEIEELKVQMLAVMPPDKFGGSGNMSKIRLSDGSPLDPNASVYTPKQLCSDA